jgi:hypothetical protein
VLYLLTARHDGALGSVTSPERYRLTNRSVESFGVSAGTMRVREWDAALIELARYRAALPSPLFAPSAGLAGTVELALNVMLLQGHGQVLLVDPGVGVIPDWFPQMVTIADLDVERRWMGRIVT